MTKKKGKHFDYLANFLNEELLVKFKEIEDATDFLLSIVGNKWQDKFSIKEITPPLWILSVGSRTFTRPLEMILKSQTTIKKLIEKYNYQPQFKFETNNYLLKELRAKKPRPVVFAPPLPKKGEGKKIIQKYLGLEPEVEAENTVKPKKTYKNSQKIIYNFLNTYKE